MFDSIAARDSNGTQGFKALTGFRVPLPNHNPHSPELHERPYSPVPLMPLYLKFRIMP